MTDINHKIERYVRSEKRKSLISLIAVLSITVPLLLFFMMPNMGNTSEVSGIVVRLVGKPTEEGQNLYLIVKLSSGDEIKTFIPNASYYRKGKTIKLQRQEPLIFGRTKYSFRGYADDGA